ncbi:xanthine dehydrogenase molybdopterin binding subunit [Oharaeibacter diazotrophicus]|uniref:Xanthine dehydrogenase molybdenum binding subunit apoprotein n=1 Tax=Oharaeibacter diazotrophicus TaxID=1920512 RepID=A0A4R6RM26_9HYPH|nr:xanthine dehydrogenase molybdopterin binding subunit [Oharaeibacter diazotrophicus]TDP87047.1 xanthine dehydrogenase molybdenum binding subunit apoprotein [Oharaeibacter diazotrophicus]BBE71010.1 xanthine dehydrogenase molybdenum-binding subunit [Pleomorphomonas sp. SM30]GLS77760.1 xanthine dehydrogenase molybdopterin binding subunit [Oharaeibacter diazotrophicus]
MSAVETRPEDERPLSVVRQPLPHDSAELHVTGRAVYIDDMREPAGTLHLAPGWCPNIAKGVIRDVDLTRVRAAPGVVAVITAKDVPGVNDCSPSIGGDPVLADGEIEFWGQVVFCVVAETRDQARRAARLALYEGEAGTPIVTAEAAKAAGTTVLPEYRFGRGELGRAYGNAQRRTEGRFVIGGQEHFYLESQIAMAIPGEAGDVHVWSSTQHPTEVQHIVAKVLGIPDAAVTAEVRRMGGGFGGKESQATQWACLAALAAKVTGRPCKIRLDRDDDFVMTGKRHDMVADFRVGFDGEGRLLSADMHFLSRCGYSADLSLGVNDRTMFHADNAYYYPTVQIRSERLKTNTVSNTAFRGFGGPQGVLAAERMMDTIAVLTGFDPLEVRKRNFYGPGRDVTPYGMKVEDNVLAELVGELEKSSDYLRRRQEIRAFNGRNRILKRGIALTPVKFGISFTLIHLNQAGALVHVYTDGSVHLNHGGTEMGQGLFTKVAQVVAEEFGIGFDRVRITATTTAKVPNSSPTAASSGTDLNGMAAQIACREIKGRMIDFVAQEYGTPPEQIDFRDGQVIIGNGSVPFAEIVKKCYTARVQLSSAGYYSTPKITWNRDKAEGRPFYYFAYGAACSEVVVDTMTGEMKVERVDLLHDCGRSLNPALDIGQIEGGFVQGMGWLTTEELVFDDKGRLRTHAPSTYKIPCCSDVPDAFTTKLFDGVNREESIYRSKAVGEPPLMLACSVFSAIFDAIASLKPGVVPPLDAPATPEAIMRAVTAMRRAEG